MIPSQHDVFKPNIAAFLGQAAMLFAPEVDRDLEVPAVEHDEASLPPALAFLTSLLPPDLLRKVAQDANRIGVAPDLALLHAGTLDSETYYRALAGHLGLPFATRPLRLASSATLEGVVRLGVAPLRPNREGLRCVAAPRGQTLERFLDLLGDRTAAVGAGLVITTPERLDALARVAHRSDLQRAASHGLPDWDESLSARGGLTPGQRLAIGTIVIVLVGLACISPSLAFAVVQAVFIVAASLLVGLRLVAAKASPPPREGGAPPWPDSALPVYSIVVPLYREMRVLARLIEALDALDYPQAKLDIILMVETDDHATLAAIEQMRLPARYRTVMAPPGQPQTKPRALNIGLIFARGAFLVVYDAEDEPEPTQLRAAVARFAERPELACLQAKLAIDNRGDTWITQAFALEYMALFDVINPGLAALDLPVPLGGTSNHFRTEVLRALNGWDAWNVTEDIDLGIRLARFGKVVGTLDSSTFEEAPNTLKAWLAQRRRWLKGWIVTLGTHLREPRRLHRELGPRRTVAVVALLFGTVLCCLLGPFSLAGAAWWIASGQALRPRSASQLALSLFSLVLAFAGLAAVIVPTLVGAKRRRAMAAAVWIGVFPGYFVLLSLAAWRAAFEAITRPFSWAKTEHGRARSRGKPPTST